MNVIQINKRTVHYLETDEEDCNFYTRYSANTWSVVIGDSNEFIYNNETIAELEAWFQKWSLETEEQVKESIDKLPIIPNRNDDCIKGA